jgi:hypothetical protein
MSYGLILYNLVDLIKRLVQIDNQLYERKRVSKTLRIAKERVIDIINLRNQNLNKLML